VRLITAATALSFIPTVQAIKYTIIIFLPVPFCEDYFVATNLTKIFILFVGALSHFFMPFEFS
jgi:hypothetical protein